MAPQPPEKPAEPTTDCDPDQTNPVFDEDGDGDEAS